MASEITDILGFIRAKSQVGTSLAVCALAGFLVSGPALAQDVSWTPAQVSLLPTVVQLPTQDAPVKGFSLNLYYGEIPSVSGLQLGAINEVETDFKGIGLGMVDYVGNDAGGVVLGLVSYVNANVTGVQLGLLANHATTGMTGVQLGLGNDATTTKGVQLGGFSSGGKQMTGLQLGGVGKVSGKMKGAQLNGVASVASEECSGLQMGLLLNYAGSGRCLQLGLVNAAPKGFLPYFPLFNYSR